MNGTDPLRAIRPTRRDRVFPSAACLAAALVAGCVGEPKSAAPARPSSSAGTGTHSAESTPTSEPSAPPAAKPAAPVFDHAPTRGEPVVVAAAFDPPTVAPGGTTTFTLKVRTAPTWHIYPRSNRGANAPAALTLELPAGATIEGDWEDPVPVADPISHAATLAGDFAFRVKVRLANDAAAGSYAVTCTLAHQACDPMMCRPPESVAAKATLTIGSR